MPSRNRDVETALLTWVNSFPGLPKKVHSLADLADGIVLRRILEDFNSSYAELDLEEITPSSKWLAKKKNLEAVYKALARYINNHCNSPAAALVDPVDFNAIAEHDDAQQTIKVAGYDETNLEAALADIYFQLLGIFLMAAVNSPENQRYIHTIQNLGGEATSQMAKILQELFAEAKTSKLSYSDDVILPPKLSSDLGLAIEQEFAQLRGEHDLLRKNYADTITRFEMMRGRYESLVESNGDKDKQIEALQSSNSEAQADYIKSLRNKVSDGENVIATHEAQAEEDRIKIQSYEHELARLRPAASRLLELEDEVKELQAEKQTLTKTANKVHHYAQKLEQYGSVEKEIARLREQNQTLQSNQRDYDQIHHRNAQMAAEIAQYREKFEEYERTASEAEQTIRWYKDTLREKDSLLEAQMARLAHDEKFIVELQESINAANTVIRLPDSPTGRPGGLSLEEELEQSEGRHAPNYVLEISRLKAENQLLKSNTAGTTNATLRVDLENAERLRKRLEVQLQELNEKYAIGQEQLNALISTSSGEKLVKIMDRLLGFGPLRILTEGFYRNEAISNTRKLWLDATKELATARSRIADLQTELNDRDRQILAAQADLSAVDEDEIDALNELKMANELITSSLQNDLLVLQGQHKALTTDFELQKTQLLEALLAKDKALAEIVNLHEMVSTNDNILLAKAKAEERMKEERDRNEQIEKQELVIQDLTKKLKAAEENSPDAQKATNEALIKNLIRENALIATAWYSLSSQLQSNHVALQRRPDTSKSWLNKQRQMVIATPRR